MIKSTTVNELKQWLDNDEALLIDVREPGEYSASNIECATLIPLSNISHDKLPKLNGKKLVIHCRSGMRSANACKKLLTENSELEVYNLEGGIMAWEKDGNATKSSGKKILPLDQQVQLTIGILLIITAVLTLTISSLFTLIAAFIGAGLTFAGLTGTCGLAMLIAKMPWNQCK